jgi:hypothetical protein
MLVRWMRRAWWEAYSLGFFMVSVVLAVGLLVISILAVAVVLGGQILFWGVIH